MTLPNAPEDEKKTEHRACLLACLKRAELFSELSDEEMSSFLDAAQLRSYKKGRILYIEGERAEFFYVICSGWVKLFHTLPEGEEIIIDMLSPGNIVGESSVFEQSHHTSSAQIVEDVQLLSIPLRTLQEQIRQSQPLALAMLASLSRHYRRHYGEIALNTVQSAPQRVGRFLLRLCPRNKKDSIFFHLPYDKTLIAHTLGMKGATFSRALNILRQKTGIRISGTRVEIDVIEPLVNFVYGMQPVLHAQNTSAVKTET